MHSSTDARSSISLRHAVAAVLALAAVSLQFTHSATAQEAKSDDVTNLSDVNVSDDPLRALSNDPSASSFGFAKPLLETPRSVSFVSEEQLSLFSVRSVEDLTRLVPGTYTTTRYGLQGGINVRGVSADMYYRGMKRLNMQGHVRTILSAYDNIEVVKGPPSPLYGMGKIGGYENLDPKSGRAKTGKYMTTNQGYVTATVGSYQETELQFGAGVPFTVGGKSAGLYVVGLLEDSDSFVRHVGAQQRFVQATMSVDNAVGPFRLETGGQAQNSITSGAYMNRVTQNLIDHGTYITGSPMKNLDLNGDGRIGYVETYLGSPVSGTISGSNQALTQRYTWRRDANGDPIPLSQFKDSIVGIPETMKNYLTSDPTGMALNCPLANYMRTSAVVAMTPGTTSTATGLGTGSLVTRSVPVGFVLNPCSVGTTQVDYRGNGAYEREQNALQKMGYFDLVYDTDPTFTLKNQVFYDSLESFKDSWLPYGENQGIRALEDKVTVTKQIPVEWLPEWLKINSLGSINYRTTSGYIRSSGGDFDYRQDIMVSSGADGSGTGGHTPNTMFWTQLTNASYATGAPATSWRISQFSEQGLGLMFDIDILKNTNLLVGGRYDKTHAEAEDVQVQNPSTGTVTATDYTQCTVQVSGCPGGITPRLKVSGSDSGTSWSASLSHQLPWGAMRPYLTKAQSTLTLDGSNNLFATGTIKGGKLVGSADMTEAGIKGAFLGGKIQWTLDAFRQTRNDVSSPSDPSVSVEVTSTETKGLEGDIKFAPTKSLFVSLSGTYMKSEYVVGANNTNIDVNARDLGFQDIVDPSTGAVYPAEAFMYGGRVQLVLTDPNNIYKDVPGLPHIQGALTATYKLPYGFGLQGGAQYFSDSWANRIKTETIPAATIFNIGATWDRGKTHLKLNGFNITDEVYFKAGSGGNSNLVSVMPTFRWEASLKMEF